MRLPLVGVSLLLTTAARADGPCGELLQRHDALVRQAHAAEVALVQATRRTLCPRLENEAEHPQSEGPPFDYGAYNQCRLQAEELLARQQRVLHRNHQGLPYYSREGARLAREADALLQGKTSPAACGGVSADRGR